MSHVRIVEEAPGVPADEQYYLSGAGLPGYPDHLHFATSGAARRWCEMNGHTYETCPFEP